MKKQLFIIISLLLFAANTNTASGYNNVLHETNNLSFGLPSSAYSNNGILDGSTELSRIGRALVHKGHKKFWNHSATQNGITALSWLAPIGEGITFLSNIIRTGAKLITKQAVKEGAKAIGKNVVNNGTKIVIQFGKTENQIYHAFRHTDALGINRSLVQSTIETHFKTISSQVIAGKHFNQIIEISGQRIQYTAFKLPNGTFNIGRIHGIK
jgi:hypothetical protein